MKFLRIVQISLLVNAAINAAPGCLDNSWHLTKAFDHKEYHVVTQQAGQHTTHCLCPCRNISNDRGYCSECGHYRDMKPWIIIRSNN